MVLVQLKVERTDGAREFEHVTWHLSPSFTTKTASAPIADNVTGFDFPTLYPFVAGVALNAGTDTMLLELDLQTAWPAE